jgi:hypothetical protein
MESDQAGLTGLSTHLEKQDATDRRQYNRL